MKNPKLLFVTFLFSLRLAAQDISINQISHKNIWMMTVPSWFVPGYDYELTYSKDSFELENKWYRKQLIKKGINGAWEETSLYYREEQGSIFKKVIGRDEQLAYNYAAAVGDTLRSVTTDLGMVVTNIEIITTNDGKERRKLALRNLCFQNTITLWIEGVGELNSQDDLTLGCIIYDPITQFNCMRTDASIIYTNGSCISSTTSAENDINLIIHPNPAYDDIQITGEVEVLEYIEIADMTGRIMIQKGLAVDRMIDVKSLKSGLYICQIISKNGIRHTLKFMKL